MCARLGVAGLTLAGHFGLVNPYNLVFDPLMIWHKFQVSGEAAKPWPLVGSRDHGEAVCGGLGIT